MKLSKVQKELMNKMREWIDRAREFETYDEYFEKYEAPHKQSAYDTPEKYKSKSPDDWKWYEETWQKKRNGIVYIHCNSRTLYKLQEFGLIELIHDSKNDGGCGIDTVKVLNY